MLKQAMDFKIESDSLYQLLQTLDEKILEQTTQFKGWTINDIVQHLHFFNYAASLSLNDEKGLLELLADLRASQVRGETMLSFTNKQLKGIRGELLLELWQKFYNEMTGTFKNANPKTRVKWAGPDMSVLSSITARLMETWSHGQAVYDVLGVVRRDRDYIRNIVILGNNTFEWAFHNRKKSAPRCKPFLRLVSPSKKIWEFNQPSEENFIEGAATEFCQVVSQTRNIQDTKLAVVGTTANKWMSIAQCFAGPPQTPPAPGTRFLGSTKTDQ